jgi:hypothetical protein
MRTFARYRLPGTPEAPTATADMTYPKPSKPLPASLSQIPMTTAGCAEKMKKWFTVAIFSDAENPPAIAKKAWQSCQFEPPGAVQLAAAPSYVDGRSQS